MAEASRVGTLAGEFLGLPESMLSTELIDGEVLVSPAPELKHQDTVLAMARILEQLMLDGKVRVAPVDVQLDEANVVQPDVLWTAPDSKCIPVEGKYLHGAPDLVVEVLSPSTARYDRAEKFGLYEQHGTLEYWLVDSQAQYVEVWRRVAEKFERQGVFGPEDSFESALLDGMQVKLEGLFAE